VFDVTHGFRRSLIGSHGVLHSRTFPPNVKPGPPPVAAPERSDGAATGGRAEALVGLFALLSENLRT
jgi:hypothetical protein